MKKFIREILSFFLWPTIIGVPLLVGVGYYVHTLDSEFDLDTDIHTVFIGDSHVQQGINDSLLPHSLNLGTSSESFYFSYFKLEKLLSRNPSINKVCIGISYHSLSSYYDNFISGNKSAAISPKYFYLLPFSQQLKLLSWNKSNMVSFLKGIGKKGFHKIRGTDDFLHMGGYSSRFDKTKAVKSSMDKRIHFQYYSNEKTTNFSELNLHYFDKIIELCSRNGIEIVAINTPLHPYYLKQVPTPFKNKLTEVIQSKNINYIDFSGLELSDSCFIPDGDHVSKLGATTISKKLLDSTMSMSF